MRNSRALIIIKKIDQVGDSANNISKSEGPGDPALNLPALWDPPKKKIDSINYYEICLQSGQEDYSISQDTKDPVRNIE